MKLPPDVLETLRYLARGDRNGKLITPAGDIQDLIAELDAYRAIVRVARMIGRQWRDQEGINGALLDELARLATDAE